MLQNKIPNSLFLITLIKTIFIINTNMTYIILFICKALLKHQFLNKILN